MRPVGSSERWFPVSREEVSLAEPPFSVREQEESESCAEAG